jgi:hypothetical protein
MMKALLFSVFIYAKSSCNEEFQEGTGGLSWQVSGEVAVYGAGRLNVVGMVVGG